MEAKVNNSDEMRKIRKSRSTLVVVGTGIMMFGLWAAVKSYGVLLLRKDGLVQDMMASMASEGTEATPVTAFLMTIAFTTIYVLAELGVRAFVGKSAIAEGRGKKKGKAYIVWTYILIFFTLISILLEIAGIVAVTGAQMGLIDVDAEGATQSNAVTAMIIDMTSLIMMIQMLVSAHRVRKYKKQQNIKEAAHAA